METSAAMRRVSTRSTSSRDSQHTYQTYDSRSTGTELSSIHDSPEPHLKAPEWDSSSTTDNLVAASHPKSQQQPPAYLAASSGVSEDISPGTSLCPRASVDTYDSRLASEEDLVDDDDEDMEDDGDDGEENDIYVIPDDDSRYSGGEKKKRGHSSSAWSPMFEIPEYRRVAEHDVISSTPHTFARLFPSMDRLSVRHDDLTSDGNMNLRVDVTVPGSRRRPSSVVQLFHLRMQDLARREFSFRRYSRDSGREVCKSVRKFDEPQSPEHGTFGIRRPSLSRSVSSALKVLTPRAGPRGNFFGGGGNNNNNNGRGNGGSSAAPMTRANSSASYDGDDEHSEGASARTAAAASSTSCPASARASRQHVHPTEPPVPTSTIKLEFSNYARVDVTRRGGLGAKRYEFDWWGHSYAWKRVVDKTLGTVSFHLVRDGQSAPVAHVVPETRSPTQVLLDDAAGGWVPPCHMWISDASIIDAVTDVADVVVATGLIALVDDCIKERCEQKPRRTSVCESSPSRPRALVHSIFGRRYSEQPPSSPLRFVDGITSR